MTKCKRKLKGGKKVKKKVIFGKKCSLCRREPIIGLIDLTEKGDNICLCEKHIKEFCKKTLKSK